MGVICIINNKDQQRHYVNYYRSKTDEVNSVSFSKMIILPNVILESVHPGGRKRKFQHTSPNFKCSGLVICISVLLV